MRYFGPILAVGLTTIVILIVAVFSFLPIRSASVPVTATPPPVIQEVLPTNPTQFNAAQIEAEMLRREATYQAQITQLEQAFKERQTTYQQQIQTLTEQVNATQPQVNELKRQEETLGAQVIELQANRNERLAQYQQQLQQAQAQYSTRLSELHTMIDDLRVKLAQANAQLGR